MIDFSSLKQHALAQKNILVLGLGNSGVSTAHALHAAGLNFVVADDNPDHAKKLAAQHGWLLAGDKIDWPHISALIPSPGIPPHNAVIQAAQQHQIPIYSDVDLVQMACHNQKFVAITGTNGKSTTTALSQHVLQHCGLASALGGNIGKPAAAAMPALPAGGVYVLELSSYMLAISHIFAADVAVLLNITPDHLAWHGDMAHYIASKSRIAHAPHGKTQTLILGIDSAPCADLAAQLVGSQQHQIVPISTCQILPQGISVVGGILYEDGQIVADMGQHLYLKGQHNFENIAASFAVARACGITNTENLLASLLSFKGLVHRQQHVGQVSDVHFINDSKATNADATAKALACFNNVFWLVGGQAKEDELNGLENFYPKIQQAFLIGDAQDRFADILSGHNVPWQKCGTIANATQAAFVAAQKFGQKAIVLLSPACASFDQYKNFEERGDDFVAHVQKILDNNTR